jgi:glycerol kinase
MPTTSASGSRRKGWDGAFPPGFLVIGHRGAAARAPENTAPSFEAALAVGAPAVELDVQLTADGRALVHHDSTTKRVCGHTGTIRSLTLDECRSLHVRPGFRKGKTWTRIRLLSLDEALGILRPDAEVHVELKGVPADAPELAQDVLGALRRTGGFEGAMITSAVPELLLEVRRCDGQCRLGVVFPSRPSFDLEELCHAIDAVAVVPNRSHVTRTWLQDQHGRGRKVFPYTVNTQKELLRLARVGVDGVVTDDPGLVLEWWRANGGSRRRKVASSPGKRPYVLSVDIGSTEIKVGLVTASGDAVRVVRKPVPALRGPRGEIGLDAEALERTVSRSIAALLRDFGDRVACLSVASQRSTFVLWDRRTGKPVGDAPSWRCLRGRRIVAARKDSESLVRERTGLRLSPSYSASKIAWKLRRATGPRRNFLCGPLPTYLFWKWSSGSIFRTDPTLAARTLLMNLARRQWDPDLLRLFGIPREILPDIGDTFGERLQVRFGDTSLRIGCQIGDQQAALVSFCPDARNPRRTTSPYGLNLGTGGFLLAGTGSRPQRVEGLLTSVAWTRSGETEYLLEGTVHRVVPSLRDLAREHVIDELALAELLSRERSDAFVLPAQEGLGAPFWDARRRFLVRGSRHPAAVVRGVLEAVGFLVRENLLLMAEVASPPSVLMVGGGLSRNPHLLQILADTLAVEVAVSPIKEATLSGAALLAHGRSNHGERIKLPLRVIRPRTRAKDAAERHLAWRAAMRLDAPSPPGIPVR